MKRRTRIQMQADIASGSKVCGGSCGRRLSFNLFGLCASSVDGRCSSCLECHRYEGRSSYRKRCARSAPTVPTNLISSDEIVGQSIPMPDNDSAIYFLIDGAEVVYIGKSPSNVSTRIRQHFLGKSIVFQRVFILRCRLVEIDNLERAYIGRLHPKYNKYYNGENVLFGATSNEVLGDL